jgi:hypothetical protein
MILIAKAIRRRPADLLMALEALVLLAFFRVCLVIVPVRRIIGAITHNKLAAQQSSQQPLSDQEMTAARRVQWAVRAIARHFPVEFVCFPQALAAYLMLRWRGLASTIVYGVSRTPAGKLIAHAWLEMGDGCVVGGEESEGFSPIERWW